MMAAGQIWDLRTLGWFRDGVPSSLTLLLLQRRDKQLKVRAALGHMHPQQLKRPRHSRTVL
jgi:hypothetical protein